jgi:glucosylceramidase
MPCCPKLTPKLENNSLVRWPGFGGAFTDAGGYVWSKLNKNLQNQVLEAYFGATGNHYTLCRTHIASCDFSVESYTFAPTPGDFQMKNFSLDPDRKHLMPFIKAAHQWSVNPIKMFATPWSPPPWMKINQQFDSSAQPYGLLDDPKMHQAYAKYISTYLNHYKAEGINFWGMTIQNEPEFAAPWEACCYRPKDMLAHLRDYLSPVMKAEHPDMKIMIYDHNKDHVAEWVDTFFNQNLPSSIRDMADGTAFHWYSGPQFENLAKAHEIAPDKFLLATEACNCPGVLIDDWGRGEHYGSDIMGDLNNWAVGWVDWNMILDPQGGPNHLKGFCDSPIIGFSNQTIHFQPPYYYMGHFSRFILPGYIRINSELNTASSPLLVTAFTDGETQKETVLVVMNPTDSPLDFSLSYNHQWAYYNTLPHSIVTFKWRDP